MAEEKKAESLFGIEGVVESKNYTDVTFRHYSDDDESIIEAVYFNSKGLLHNTYGPAVNYFTDEPDGYFLNGVRMTPEEWQIASSDPIKMTKREIEALLGRKLIIVDDNKEEA